MKILLIALSCLLVGVTRAAESFHYSTLRPLRGPFGGMDRNGRVLHVETLGMLGNYPLVAYWTSARDVSSPLFGRGWRFPLLECTVVEIEDGVYELVQPDGQDRIFFKRKRVGKSGYCLSCKDSGWNGTFRSENDLSGITIRYTGKVGKRKVEVVMSFKDGMLRRLQSPEGELVLAYGKDGKLEEVLDGHRTCLLKIVPTADGKRLIFGRKGEVDCKLAPDWHPSGSRNESYSARTTLTFQEDGRETVRTFDFSIGGDLGTLAVSDGSSYSWNVARQTIARCGGWTYEVVPPNEREGITDISRRNDFDRSSGVERYRVDLKRGEGYFRQEDGVERQWLFYTSGSQFGRVYEKVEKYPDGRNERFEWTYGDDGTVRLDHFVNGERVR